MENEKNYYQSVTSDMEDSTAIWAIHNMSDFLSRYYGKKVIILLDEYDTPMQEAYVNGYWDELAGFIRSLFNAAFKTNPCLKRAVMTGITRVSKESIFSDLNNLKVVTTISDEYAERFGFTEEEVFAALDEFCMSERKADVKQWYDEFTFGNEPERFYHGFVLGLMAELSDRYVITSNRESGFGRYDVMLEPRNKSEDAMILEFKVQDIDDGEKELGDAVETALKQIRDKAYETTLVAKGIPAEQIRKYGFAFCGKQVLIGTDEL